MNEPQVNQPKDNSNSNQSDKWANIKTLIAIISALVAAFSCYFALQSLKSNERVARINTYMILRENFREIIKDVPHPYFEENSNAPQKGSEVWRKISDYWYLSFDEWYITTQLGDPNLKELWANRYRFLIAAQLDKKAFREVVCYLIEEKFSQNELQKKFGNELEKLYKERNNKGLCLK